MARVRPPEFVIRELQQREFMLNEAPEQREMQLVLSYMQQQPRRIYTPQDVEHLTGKVDPRLILAYLRLERKIKLCSRKREQWQLIDVPLSSRPMVHPARRGTRPASLHLQNAVGR